MLNTSEIPGPASGFSSAFSSATGTGGSQQAQPNTSASAHADLARHLLQGLSVPMGGASSAPAASHHASATNSRGIPNLDISAHHGWGSSSSVDGQSVGSHAPPLPPFHGPGSGGMLPVSAPPSAPPSVNGYITPAASPASNASSASFWHQQNAPHPGQGGFAFAPQQGFQSQPMHTLETSPGVGRFLRGRAGSVASTDSKMSSAVMLLPPNGAAPGGGYTSVAPSAAAAYRSRSGTNESNQESRTNLLGFGLGGVPGLVDGGDDNNSFLDGQDSSGGAFMRDPPAVRAERSNTGQDSMGGDPWGGGGSVAPELPFLRKSTVRGAGSVFSQHSGPSQGGAFQAAPNRVTAVDGAGMMGSVTTAGAGLAPRNTPTPTKNMGGPPGFSPYNMGRGPSPMQQMGGGMQGHPPPPYAMQSTAASAYQQQVLMQQHQQGQGHHAQSQFAGQPQMPPGPSYPPSDSPFRHMPVPGHPPPAMAGHMPGAFAPGGGSGGTFSTFEQLVSSAAAHGVAQRPGSFIPAPGSVSTGSLPGAGGGIRHSPGLSPASGPVSAHMHAKAMAAQARNREVQPPQGSTETPPFRGVVPPIAPTPLRTSSAAASTAGTASASGGTGRPRGRPPKGSSTKPSATSSPPADLPDDIPLQFDPHAPRVPGQIGAYPPAARQKRLERFQAKRGVRMWRRKVKYNVRKDFADQRMRVKGRFVKKEDEETLKYVVQMI